MPLSAPSQSWPSTSQPCWRGTRQESHVCKRLSSRLWLAPCWDASSSSRWASTHSRHLLLLINSDRNTRVWTQETVFAHLMPHSRGNMTFVMFSGNLHDHRRTETQRANVQQSLYWRELSAAVHLRRRQVDKHVSRCSAHTEKSQKQAKLSKNIKHLIIAAFWFMKPLIAGLHGVQFCI